MTIHSIVTDEILYAGMDHISESEEMVINGMLMLVERISIHQVKVCRLISPVPTHYLLEQYAPGQIIDFHSCR